MSGSAFVARRSFGPIVTIMFFLLAFSGPLGSLQPGVPDDRAEITKENGKKDQIEALFNSLKAVDSSNVKAGEKYKPKFSVSSEGYIKSLIAPPNHYFPVTKLAKGNPVQTAKNFIEEYSVAFGIENASFSFLATKEQRIKGRDQVRFQQQYGGIPVFSGELIAHLINEGGIQYILTDILRDAALEKGDVSLTPSISAAKAQESAIGFISNEYKASDLKASSPILAIYEPSIVGNSGPTRLAWQTEVADKKEESVKELVLIDANNGEIALHFSKIYYALNREIYDSANSHRIDYGILKRIEGGPPAEEPEFAEVNRAYEYFGDVYYYYLNHHGRDGADNQGHTISASVRWCPLLTSCPWINAEYSSGRFHFGPGLVADDVVAHEYTHWVTEQTSGLIYQNQSGAINESFSDTWGTFVDFENGGGDWLLGEDTSIGAIRSMSNPPAGGQPDKMSGYDWGYIIPSPLDDWGRVHKNSGIGNKLVYLLVHGGDFNNYHIDPTDMDRVADIYYDVQVGGLTSGSDYFDLHDALANAAITNNWSNAECENLENACRAVEISSGILDVRPSNLIINKPGIVNIDVVAPSAGDFYVVVRDDDGTGAPGWTWPYTKSATVSIEFVGKHTFSLWVTPTDSSEPFEIVLMKNGLVWDAEEDTRLVTLAAQAPDSNPPTILSYSFTASRYTLISVKFDENMDITTFKDQTVSVVGSSSGAHSCYYGFDCISNTLTIDPISAFSYGETITVTVGTGVTDVSGNHLASPYQFSFSIENTPSTNNVPPSLQFTAPVGAEVTSSGYYVIRWTDEDPDDNAVIKLYYDTDNNFGNSGYLPIKDENGTAAQLYEDSNQDSFFWDTNSVNVGTFYILAVLEDHVNAPIVQYSAGTVQVARPATGTHFGLSSIADWTWDDNNTGNNQAYVNGVPEGLEILDVNIPIKNSSGTDLKFVHGYLSSTVSAIDFSNGNNYAYYDNPSAGQKVTSSDEFRFKVNIASYANTPFKLHLEYQDLSGNHYLQDLNFTYTFPIQGGTAPHLIVSSIQIDDNAPRGDGDGIFESGEKIDFFVSLKNDGNALCVNPKGDIEQRTSWGTNVFTDLTNLYPDIQPGKTEVCNTAYDTDNAPINYAGDVSTKMTIWYGPDRDKSQVVNIPLSVAPTPHILLSKESYDWGVVSPGTPVAYQVTIGNRGSGNLSIASITPSNSDTTISGISGFPVTITPGGNPVQFTINIDTTSLSGFITRTVSINSNAYGETSKVFTLTGVVGNIPAASYAKIWEKSIASIDNNYNNLVVGDTDNDGNQEIITTSAGLTLNTVPHPAHIYIYEKVANDDFQLKWTSPDLGGVYFDTHSLALGDFDADGYTDIVVLATSYYLTSNVRPYKVLWFEATGNDTWVSRGTPLNAGSTDYLNAMTVGDSDNDGKLEIIVSRQGSADPRVLVYEYASGSFPAYGSPTYSTPAVIGQNGTPVSKIPLIKVADTDGDGNNEIIFGTDEAQLYIYERTGNNTYTQRLRYDDTNGDYLGWVEPKDMAVADTDGDTKKEIIHVNENGYLFILEAIGDNAWNTATPEHYPLPNSLDGYCVAVGDSDNDGAGEIIVGGYGSSSRHLAVYEATQDNTHLNSWTSTAAEVGDEVHALALVNTNATPENEIVAITPYLTSFSVIGRSSPVDLQIVANNIAFAPPTVVENGSVAITALVQNLSSLPVNNILVRFFYGDPASGGVQINGDQTIPTIPASGAASAQVTWLPLASGNYPIYVAVDPNNSISEIDEGNNKAYKQLAVIDNDIAGPQITNVLVAEYQGDGDGIIESNERVRISWSATDPSGISSSDCTIDGTLYSATGSYEVIAGPFVQGPHSFIISAVDADNSPMGSQVSGSFSVSPGVLAVSSVLPAIGATNVIVRPTIEALFSEPLSPASVNSSTVLLRDAGMLSMNGSISYSPLGNKITFVPSTDLVNSVVYTMTLVGGSGGISSLSGNTLAQSYSWSFTVEPDVTLPIAIISSPTTGQSVSGAVDIRGTAWDKNFKQYQVYYGAGSSPSSWTEITTVSAPVTGGLLCQWNTSSLANGQYSVKLVVLDNPPASNQAEARITVLCEQPTVTVTAPNGGESWEVGSSKTITWTWTGSIANVKIDYSTNGGSSWLPVVASTSNSGSYPWTVPNTVSANCKVRVADASDAAVNDLSNASFMISVARSITVTAPNGGEWWEIGTQHAITWTWTGTIVNVKIDYSRDGGTTWLPVVGVTPNNGIYTWAVPEPWSSNCLIKVSDASDPSIFDTSDSPFAITPTRSLTVTSPNGGENWEIGTQRDITWTYQGMFSNVKIELNRGSGWEVIVPSTPNNGSYTWAVTGPESPTCLVRVADATDSAVNDASNAVFAIAAARTVTVTAPNGGESWQRGTQHAIIWTPTGLTGDVTIELWKGGALNRQIAVVPVTPATYNWTIDAAQAEGSDYRVKIYQGSVTDESDGNFTITLQPGIVVGSPNGGESWQRGTQHAIIWTPTGLTGDVTIDLWKGGALNRQIAVVPMTPATYNWTIDAAQAEGSDYRVKIYQGSVTDESDGNFTITLGQGIVVGSPNGGESWQRGTQHAITWTPTGLTGDVTIELWKGGALNRAIATVPVTPASYNWTIDAAQAEGSDYRVKIYHGTVADESDGNFAITLMPPGSLQLMLSPAEAVTAGAKWRVDGGAWQDSGAIVNDLFAGQHPVEYKPLEGWTAPSQETVTIESGQTKQITRSYVRLNAIKHAVGDFDGDKSEEVVFDFGPSGAWMYDSGTWTQLTAYDPDGMIPFDIDGNGDDELAIDLGALGLWMWNGGIWSQLTVNSPESMIVTDTNDNGIEELILDYGSAGLGWRQENGSWFGMTPYDPQNIIAVHININFAVYRVVAEFGPVGMWAWEGLGTTWYRMSSADASTMAGVDAYGSGNEGVVAGFTGLGTFLWDGGFWGQLSSIAPENVRSGQVELGGGEEIVADFGDLGLWRWGASVWTQMSGVNADDMILANTDGDGEDEVLGDFASLGLWLWNGGSWTQLSGVNPEGILAADIDGDKAKEVIGDFGSLGVWLWNDGSWTQISVKNPD